MSEAKKRSEEAKNTRTGIQGEDWPGGGARREDDQRNRAGIRRASGPGGAVQEADPGAGKPAISWQARTEKCTNAAPGRSRTTPARMRSDHLWWDGKGWLFCDTVGGAHASANLYSLIETCKANGVNPYRYLIALFKALPQAKTA